MKIIFFGSSVFSCPILEKLSSAHEVLAVVTTPAKPQGRGLKLLPNPVEELAKAKRVLSLAPPDLKDPAMREKVLALGCDVFVVASYGKILPPAWLSVPGKFPLNIHPSLLPKYRGAAPINWQLMRGEALAGVTVFRMEQGLDSGPIAAQREFAIGAQEDAVSLARKLSLVSCEVVLEVLQKAEADALSFIPQKAEEATLAPKLKREDGLIDWARPAIAIANQVRGLVPWPCAHVLFKGEILQVLKARVSETRSAGGKPGDILEISRNGFLRVRTGNGDFLIDQVKPAGKREMTAHEFAIGRHLTAGMAL